MNTELENQQSNTVDSLLPVPQLVAYGLQHVLAMYAGVTPMVLWSMLLSGTGVADAVFMQILMLSAMLAAAPVSLLITLAVARVYSFDAYGQLKNMDKTA